MNCPKMSMLIQSSTDSSARFLIGFLAGLACLAFLVMVSCGKDSPTGPSPPTQPPVQPPPPPAPSQPTRVTVTPGSANLTAIGQTVKLSATVYDQRNAQITGASVTWSSNNTAVATVSAQGLVTAVGNGMGTITARAGNASASVPVTVMQSAGSITIEPSSATLMALRETVQLTATVLDQNEQPVAGAVVSWSSNNTAVATVNPQGLVTAVGNGTATITARAGNASASVPVTVMQSAGSITIEPSSATLMALGETAQLTATVLDRNGQPVSGAVVTWASSDEAVATVSAQGLVTAVSNGTATITARAGDASATAEVTVLVPRTDRDRLIAFYESAGGGQWTVRTNWLSVHPLETWHGVTANSDGRVTGIELPNNNLRGPLTSEMGDLEELATLRLNHNRLTGPVPPELGRLGKLRQLVLSSNQLSGTIPGELGQLAGLEELVLSFNRLTGSIPAELGGLASLTRLSLSVNELNGPIPSELGRLGRLTSLRLDQNRLSGPIPSELSGLRDLQSLVLASNRLTGAIPSRLSLLNDLTELSLDHNGLEGGIPSQLGGLAGLKRLGLAGNRLSGGAPSALGSLSGLTHLRLFSNPDLAGILPRSYTNLQLEELLLEGTQLCVPQDADYAAWLETIRVKTVTPCANLESGALIALYGATNGQTWQDNSNWLSGRPVDTWFGVTADAEGRVTRIDLANNNLRGALPGELAGLANLESLNLAGNGFLRGPLPRTLIQLGLRELRLEGTRLCAPRDAEFQAWLGTIPSGSVPACDDLDLDTLKALFALFNRTNGPAWNDRTNWNGDAPLQDWYGVTVDGEGRVTGLDLADNNLSGGLPAALAALSGLERLDFSGNAGLTGPLPREWTALDLAYLRTEGTDLCAPPDDEFQAWLQGIPEHSVPDACADTGPEWNVLAQFYDSTNGGNWTNNANWLSEAPLDQWHGVTTDEAGAVTALDLRNNNLSGELPPGLADLSGLTSLNLSENNLSGVIPVELGQLTGLEYLNLFNNNLSGAIPVELGLLSNLAHMEIADNNLSGVIPPELGRLERLTHLRLNSNALSGRIPAELGQLSNLYQLNLGGNALSGSIPPELGNLANLGQLALFYNNLSGVIPPELGRLGRLWQLYLDDNALSGQIPAELGQLSSLSQLYAPLNNLSGTIPSELSQLTGLIRLDLSRNNLSGSIPLKFDQLTSLATLDLGSNPLLSGALPGSLTRLPLETLQLGGTALCAPPTPAFQTWLRSIRNSRVASCSEFTGAAAYLTQAAQSMAHPVPLVAGEAALLRVFVTADPGLGADMPPVRAVFYNGGQVVHSVDIPPGDAAVPERIDEGTLMHSANTEIPGPVVTPGLEMVVYVDPRGATEAESGAAMRVPETGRQPLDARTVPPFDLTLVPFLWTESPHVAVLAETEGLTAGDDLFWQTRNLLPIADFEVEVRDPVWTATDPIVYNSYEMLQETKAIRVLDGSGNYYMGILRAGGGRAELPGTSSVSTLDAETIAHEIGHNLTLRHAPCGGAGGPDPYFPYGDGSIGSWGYDFRDGTLVAPGTADLMSYCHPQWISEYGFTRAMGHRGAKPRPMAAVTRFDSKGLLVWGGVAEDGELELQPAFAVDAPPAGPALRGPYRLAGRAANGGVLFEMDFGMSELGCGGGHVFAFVLPARADWAERLYRITLSGPEGVVSVGRDSDLGAALLFDRDTGMARGILRDWPDPSDALLGARRTLPEPGLEIVVSPGVPDPDSW